MCGKNELKKLLSDFQKINSASSLPVRIFPLCRLTETFPQYPHLFFGIRKFPQSVSKHPGNHPLFLFVLSYA